MKIFQHYELRNFKFWHLKGEYFVFNIFFPWKKWKLRRRQADWRNLIHRIHHVNSFVYLMLFPAKFIIFSLSREWARKTTVKFTSNGFVLAYKRELEFILLAASPYKCANKIFKMTNIQASCTSNWRYSLRWTVDGKQVQLLSADLFA